MLAGTGSGRAGGAVLPGPLWDGAGLGGAGPEFCPAVMLSLPDTRASKLEIRCDIEETVKDVSTMLPCVRHTKSLLEADAVFSWQQAWVKSKRMAKHETLQLHTV